MRALFGHFKEMRNYFIASALVFIAGVVLGFADSDRFATVLESQMIGLRELAQTLSAKDHSLLWLFGFIFLNNALKSIMIIFVGVFFGILPLFFLVLNGMVIGYLAEMQVQVGQFGYFLKGILPHGIFEIPAIIIACAYGIKLGGIMAKGLFGLISERGRHAFVADLRHFLKISLPLIGLLTVTLLVAAVVESTLTPLLMQL